MAGAKKALGGFTKIYLASYNLVQTLGWSYILYNLMLHYVDSSSTSSLWEKEKLLLNIFQNGAVLEIVHAALGLVSSNVVLTTFQVLSRVMVVIGVIQATPYTYAAASPGFPLAILAWSITEIIRYFYYFANIFGFVPRTVVWLRYTTFIILYPIGITGELLCFYAAVKYASANPTAWSYALPNTMNFTFSYLYFLVIIMLSYIPLFPQLYMHMFAQRRKMLNPSSITKKAR